MNLRIGTRILLGFGIMVALTLGIGWYGLSQLEEVVEFSTHLGERDVRLLGVMQQITQSQLEVRAAVGGLITARLARQTLSGSEELRLARSQWEQSKGETARLMAQWQPVILEYEKTAVSLNRAEQWRKIRQTMNRIDQASRQLADENESVIRLVERGESDSLTARTGSLDRLRRNVDAEIGNGSQLIRDQVDLGRREIVSSQQTARNSILAALAVAMLLGVICSSVIQLSITRPLAGFMNFVERVGQGDLSQQAVVRTSDELGTLADRFNGMVTSLREMALQTVSATKNLNAAAAEILASTQQQAATTAEQAAAVQQTTTTMEEITQSGAQISERAKQVSASAEATSVASKSGQEAVQNATRTMEAIREQAEALAENVVSLSEKTQAVGEIIASVNDIAEQSHLLSLNASIEAAAAGEQGRRFAVVAHEMKKLADQSKEATVQVRSILGDIQKGIHSSVMLTEETVKRVDSGKQQSLAADQIIRQLTESVLQSVQAFQQIVAGANQQQIGFEQVMQSTRSVSQASRQTASAVRQLEAAATNLTVLAGQLQKTVERYRI